MVLSVRTKILTLVLPLIVLIVIVSGTLAFLEYQAALRHALNNHLSYKAEQLRDYLYSQWSVIEDLKLADQSNFKAAAEQSFRSYAYSLLRDETERVLVLGSQGENFWSVSLRGVVVPSANQSDRIVLPPSGWFTATVQGEAIVGVAFEFAPFGWTVAMSQSESVFLSGIGNILLIHLWILLGALLTATVLTILYVGRIVRPLEHLSSTLSHIAQSADLSRRVQIEEMDEIGVLSKRFNQMLATLEQNREKLVASAENERIAKETATQREAETLLVLGRISDFRDEETGQHLNRIGAMSGLFAHLLGWSEDMQTLIRNSSPLHDLGKVAIPDAILSKPGKLSEEETAIMRQHPIFGFELLKSSQSKFLMEGAAIALAHHEKWDGSGYPRGIAGEAIPLSARIVSIVDVFDALLSERPYKQPWTPQEALEHMLAQSGKHFDPRLMAEFAKNFSLFLAIRTLDAEPSAS